MHISILDETSSATTSSLSFHALVTDQILPTDIVPQIVTPQTQTKSHLNINISFITRSKERSVEEPVDEAISSQHSVYLSSRLTLSHNIKSSSRKRKINYD